ncbi:hypothetical protein SUGI_0724940 [Cryptomeria japonica]|nr:hypothetical protein SUGI_0724940 [Cryptomeria japonica]
MIESIDKVCKQQKLTPDTTISQLIHSTDSYSFGTVGVLVTAHKQEPTEFQVQVKDGELPSDTATLTVPKIHTNSYATLEKLLTPTKSKFLLLKNVIRNGTRGASNIKSSLSTFIGELNDECTKSSLQTLGSSNTQVAGILRTKMSIYHHFNHFATYAIT